ncbi:hypothetical protein LCGC14_2502930 [marine sediment metagenome]|uniref:Uncharacterized protein n=1 Tax=marine sediment metagenome TaxID=412755 RepID=A0A0F9DV40_9ZZZZ
MEKKQLNRWLKALEIAKCVFEEQGYFTDYLEEIEAHIKGGNENGTNDSRAGLQGTADKKVVPVSSNPHR